MEKIGKNGKKWRKMEKNGENRYEKMEKNEKKVLNEGKTRMKNSVKKMEKGAKRR